MGQHIVKQSDGKYAIFSSNVDHFIGYDATAEEIYTHFCEIAIEESDRHTKRGLERADYLGEARLTEDLETVRLIHGDAAADEAAALLGKASGTHAAADNKDGK